MPTYVALLRGINLGGHNRVSMPDLRDALTGAGYKDVQTYVQSGNVVLRSRAGKKAVAAGIRTSLTAELGLDVPVVLRTGAELADVAAHNPFARDGADPGRQLHVAFLDAKPAAAQVKALDPKRAAPDELAVRGSEIYLWCPNGIGRSKVFTGVEKALGIPATVRNWRTVTELLKLASD